MINPDNVVFNTDDQCSAIEREPNCARIKDGVEMYESKAEQVIYFKVCRRLGFGLANQPVQL